MSFPVTYLFSEYLGPQQVRDSNCSYSHTHSAFSTYPHFYSFILLSGYRKLKKMKVLPCQTSLSMAQGQGILLMHYDKYQNRGRWCAITGKCCLKVLCMCMKQSGLCVCLSLLYILGIMRVGKQTTGGGGENVWGSGPLAPGFCH